MKSSKAFSLPDRSTWFVATHLRLSVERGLGPLPGENEINPQQKDNEEQCFIS